MVDEQCHKDVVHVFEITYSVGSYQVSHTGKHARIHFETEVRCFTPCYQLSRHVFGMCSNVRQFSTFDLQPVKHQNEPRGVWSRLEDYCYSAGRSTTLN